MLVGAEYPPEVGVAVVAAVAEVAGSSSEAEAAVDRPTVAAGLEVELWKAVEVDLMFRRMKAHRAR